MADRVARWFLPVGLTASFLVLSFSFLVDDVRGPSRVRQVAAEPAREPPPIDLVGSAPPLPLPLPLRFGWPAEGRVRVRGEHRREDARSDEEFELHWRPLEGGGTLVEAFPWPLQPGTAPPGPTRTAGTLLTPVQAVVGSDGRFVRTPRLGDLGLLWELSAGHGAHAPLPEPLAARWPDWVERWIGVALAPGELRSLECDNPSARSLLRCVSLDGERTRLQHWTLRPRVAAGLPGGGLDCRVPAEDEVGCELESVVDAELLRDGLRPIRVRSRSRWTWARHAADVVRVVEHESLYSFDWETPGAALADGPCSSAVSSTLQSWAGSFWPELSAAERELEAAEWKAIWPLLTAARRAEILSSLESFEGDLGMRWPQYWSWQAVRPALHRLWRAEDPLASGGPGVRTWVENGPPESSVDVLFVGEGYAAEELGPAGKYWSDVCEVSRELFEDAPFSWYRDWFNVRALLLESRESGCDARADEDLVDTALDACLEEGRLRLRNRAALRALLQRHPVAEIVFVMVNARGCAGYKDWIDDPLSGDGRTVAVFSVGCRDAHEVAAHEAGHSLADLADEYEDEDEARDVSAYRRLSPNLSLATDRAAAGWRHFLALPGAERFEWHHEGGGYRTEGVFRPWRQCRMRDDSDPFCPVCCEAVARAIHEACGLAWDDAAYHRARPLALWK